MKILSLVALETLEKLTFLFGTDDKENASVANEKPAVDVQVRFSGSFSGILGLSLSAEVLPELAANMLGLDESGPIGVEHQHDALREAANVVCGRLLPLLGGSAAEFSIEPPSIVDTQTVSLGWAPAEPVARVRLNLEAGVCDLVLAVKGPLPELLSPEAIEIIEQSMEWNAL